VRAACCLLIGRRGATMMEARIMRRDWLRRGCSHGGGSGVESGWLGYGCMHSTSRTWVCGPSTFDALTPTFLHLHPRGLAESLPVRESCELPTPADTHLNAGDRWSTKAYPTDSVRRRKWARPYTVPMPGCAPGTPGRWGDVGRARKLSNASDASAYDDAMDDWAYPWSDEEVEGEGSLSERENSEGSHGLLLLLCVAVRSMVMHALCNMLRWHVCGDLTERSEHPHTDEATHGMTASVHGGVHCHGLVRRLRRWWTCLWIGVLILRRQ
jgi:hypothetical protein